MKGAECAAARFSVWKNSINFSVCIYKQRAAKLRAEKCSCNILNNQVKILHLPRAQFTPVNEASPPPKKCCGFLPFMSLKGEKKKKKKEISFSYWNCLRNKGELWISTDNILQAGSTRGDILKARTEFSILSQTHYSRWTTLCSCLYLACAALWRDLSLKWFV